MAGKIKELLECDSCEIDTSEPYPVDYHQTTEVSKEEQRKDARPQLRGELPNISTYDVIYLGYPNWWGTMPMVLFTLLESLDTSGKTIMPFCTHEGSGLGHSVSDIKKLCPDATVHAGLAIQGGKVGSCDNALKKWLEQ